MNTDTRIVFFHKGRSWYLPYVLYQAQFMSPESEIVLIGDDYRGGGIQFEPIQNLHARTIQDFTQHYIHMSTDPEDYALFCWLRWFYLLEYMRRRHVQSVLYLDSDVLLFSSIKEMSTVYSDAGGGCGFLVPKQDFSSFIWAASAHISYWTVELLEDFCGFCANSFTDKRYLDLYREKWNWHLTKKTPGGIIDMTTLYLFWNENKTCIQNLAVNLNGNVFDCNFSATSNYENDEYIVNSGKKTIKWIDRRPFWITADGTNNLVRVHALHFQGGAKKRIPEFYTGRILPEKMRYDFLLSYVFRKQSLKLRNALVQHVPGMWRIMK